MYSTKRNKDEDDVLEFLLNCQENDPSNNGLVSAE